MFRVGVVKLKLTILSPSNSQLIIIVSAWKWVTLGKASSASPAARSFGWPRKSLKIVWHPTTMGDDERYDISQSPTWIDDVFIKQHIKKHETYVSVERKRILWKHVKRFEHPPCQDSGAYQISLEKCLSFDKFITNLSLSSCVWRTTGSQPSTIAMI